MTGMATKMVIVSAACKTKDGMVVPGARHHHCFERIRQLGLEACTKSASQGFIDQRERFYTRLEAWALAKKNNQLIEGVEALHVEGRVLFSEDLYS